MSFVFRPCALAGLQIVEARVLEDGRGSFMETFRASLFLEAGIDAAFVQENRSLSALHVLRGLHYQRGVHAQGKLIEVPRGRGWDVAVDLRRDSESFGKYFGIELSEENQLLLWIPPGFAHGFLSLEEGTELVYKCGAEYHPESEGGIRWDDPELAIEWPVREVLLSERDASLPSLASFREEAT